MLFFRVSLGLSFLLVLCMSGYLMQISYDALAEQFLQTIGRPELIQHLHTIFPVTKFHLLQKFAGFFCFVYAAFVLFLYQKADLIIALIKKSYFIFKNDIIKFIVQTNNVSSKERTILCFLLATAFVRGFYYSLSEAPSFDEAWTYNYFSSQFPLLPAVYYPSTNNHILYSVISAFFEKIPFLPALFAIRLPSLLAYIAALYVFFGAIKGWFGTAFSLWATAIFGLLYAGVVYSYQARGYSLQLFWACSNLYFFIKINKNASTKNLIYFGVTLLLGLYTIPTFLYYWVSLVLWYFICIARTFDTVKRFFYTNALVGISLIILSVPIWLTSNLGVANKNNVGNISGHYFEYLGSFSYMLVTYLTSLQHFTAIIWCTLLLLGVFCTYFIEKDRFKRNLLQLSVFLVFSPWLYFTLQQFNIPPRLFIFYLPSVALLITYGAVFLFTKIKYAKLLIVPFFLIAFFTEKLNNDSLYFSDCAEIGEKITAYQPKTIFTYDEFCKPSILFYFKKQKLPLPNILCNTNTTAKPDTVLWLINPPNNAAYIQENLELVLKNHTFTVYRRLSK